MSKQSSSDPLPWTQIDRAVKPKAAMLADALGVSRQHALGSLVEFWDLCGDPRDLEAIVSATPADEEPQVVLEASVVELRFKLASGRETTAATLEGVKLLEPLEDGRFRVRGMSRYFAPIEKRLKARRSAALGGKASAAARLEATGTAQPAGGRGFGGGSVVASESLKRLASETEASTEAEPKREPKRNGSDSEAEPKPRGQRSEVRDVKDARLKPLTERLVASFLEIRGSKYLYAGIEDATGLKRLLAVATEDEIDRRWRAALKAGANWPGTSSLAQLSGAKRWNDLASTQTAFVSIEHQPSRIY